MKLSFSCSTDIAIASAVKDNTLDIKESMGRFGPFWAISDKYGLIEVHNTKEEVDARVESIKKLMEK